METLGEAGRPFMEDDREVLETGAMKRVEETFELPGGHIQHRVALKTRATGSDGSTFVVGVTTDVTEMKQREEEAVAARMKAELAQNILDEFSSPVLVKNRDGRFVAINKAFSELLGIPPEDILGKTAADIISADNLEQAIRFEAEVMQTGKTLHA